MIIIDCDWFQMIVYPTHSFKLLKIGFLQNIAIGDAVQANGAVGDVLQAHVPGICVASDPIFMCISLVIIPDQPKRDIIWYQSMQVFFNLDLRH